MLKAITKENYAQQVEKSEKPIILDFWAEWCGPCRMLSPVIAEIADERTDLDVGKINVDEQPELAEHFGIVSIPTVVLMQNGYEVAKFVGYRDKQVLIKELEL